MFVSFEGPEGAGKSSVIRCLAQLAEESLLRPLCTREPGDGPLGARIRDMVLHGENLSPKCELFLFLADRAQHVESIVRPALVAKQLVLCDRYSDSTLVYQGYGRGLDKDLLREWNDFATGGLVPDLTLLLDIDPELGLARIVGKDRLDSEPLDFHQAVRQGFLAEAEQDPSRWSVVDASRDLETVVDDCWAAILRSLEARHK